MKSSDMLELYLDMFSPVATQSLGSNIPFSWHSNSNEEGNEIVNQDSNDGEALINHLLNYEHEQIENMDFTFSSLDVSTFGSDVVPPLHPPPGVQVISPIFWNIPLVKFASVYYYNVCKNILFKK